MSEDKNIFGGANPNGMYVPLTETEQEVLDRLTQAQDMEIEIHGWGIVHNPWVSFGDHRIGLTWELVFNKPEIPKPVYFFDLELRVASSCIFLMRKRYSVTTPDGKPTLIGAGLKSTFQWDIAIDHMSPELVKAINPGALGMTSRRLDRDTGLRTIRGNMQLSDSQSMVAMDLDIGASKIRDADDATVAKAVNAGSAKNPK